jgi:hypothetical protein
MRKVFKQRILKKNYWERGDPMAAKKTSKKSTAKRSVKRSTTSKSSLGFFVKNIEKFEHSIEFDIPRGLLAAVVFAVIAEAISFISISMNKMYYTNIAYTGLWSKFLAPSNGMIPGSFFVYSLLMSVFVGFIYAFLYHMVRVSIHGHAPHKKWVKGLLYGIFPCVYLFNPKFVT